MIGRKLDELNRTLLITGLSAMIAGNLLFQTGTLPRKILSLIATAALIFAVIRLFAGNPEKRENENIRFLAWRTGMRSWLYRAKDGLRSVPGSVRNFASRTASRFRRRDRSASGTKASEMHYRVLRCPSCRQKLRVPKGKGKIRVTCTHCGNRFEAKS